MSGCFGRRRAGTRRCRPHSGMTGILPGVRSILLASVLLVALGSLAADARASASDAAAAADSLAAAAADSLAAASADSTTTDTAAAGADSTSAADDVDKPFLVSVSNTPKVGAKADVRLYSYSGELISDVMMRSASKFSNTFSWSWEDYRKTDKTVERRSDRISYAAGTLLPVTMNLSASWNWSEDRTVNATGFTNLSARNVKSADLTLTKSKFTTGRLNHVFRVGAGIQDQKAVNQNQRNDFTEGDLSARYQAGTKITEGLSVAARFYGTTGGGNRMLDEQTANSSAVGDSVGIGAYFDQEFSSGKITITRANFDKKYLDFQRNELGTIEDRDVVVQELEATDAVSIEFDNTVRWRRLGLKTKLSRDMDTLAYAASGIGSKEKQQDLVDLTATYATGSDSFAVTYKYGWRWEDQRIQGATVNRGRQFTKSRDFDFTWNRTLFRDTDLLVKYGTDLTQDTAENQYNTNDKDRLGENFSVSVKRSWSPTLDVSMVFDYRTNQDLYLRDTRSSNNNVKDSYEVQPAYTWQVAPWLELYQNYQLYIQYTDYIYSDLENVNRDDTYNKRGVLNTRVTLKPSRRLTLIVRHDYNRRSNATRTSTDAAGHDFYQTDVDQTISKIDLDVSFKIARGVTLEGATERSEDTKENPNSLSGGTVNQGGKIWVGCKVDQKFGAKDQVELSALLRKYNAYGPGVTETSADYWEADVWLKWSF